MSSTLAGPRAIKSSDRKSTSSLPKVIDTESTLHAIVENFDGYIWCLDTELRYVFLNDLLKKQLKAVLGIDVKIGQKVLDKLDMLDSMKLMEWEGIYRLGLQGEKQRQVQQFSIDGKNIFFELSVTPIRSGKKVTGLSCFSREIPEEYFKRQQEVTKAVIKAQEKEREVIGRELHDNVTQILNTARLCLSCVEDFPGNNQMLLRSKDYVSTAIEEIRKLSKSLIQSFHSEVGLKLCVEDLVESIRLSKKFEVELHFSLSNERLIDDQLKMTAFRIIQEQLNNIIKHAQATQVEIFAEQRIDRFRICIADNGIGFDTSMKRNGIGLFNIINRAELYQGQVKIYSSPGLGCKLVVDFTLKDS